VGYGLDHGDGRDEKGGRRMPAIELEPPLPPPIRIEIDYALVLALRREAAKRDMPIGRLVRELLEVIAADNLAAAVLDADA
jgi:hypothetical protein